MTPRVVINDSVYNVFAIGICDAGKAMLSNGFLGIPGAHFPQGAPFALPGGSPRILQESLVLLLGIPPIQDSMKMTSPSFGVAQITAFYKDY